MVEAKKTHNRLRKSVTTIVLGERIWVKINVVIAEEQETEGALVQASLHTTFFVSQFLLNMILKEARKKKQT